MAERKVAVTSGGVYRPVPREELVRRLREAEGRLADLLARGILLLDAECHGCGRKLIQYSTGDRMCPECVARRLRAYD